MGSSKPFASLQERLVDEALAVNTAPAANVRGMTRRPLFLPRTGWRTEALTINDVMDLGRYRTPTEMEKMQRVSYSGTDAEINSSPRNIGQQTGW